MPKVADTQTASQSDRQHGLDDEKPLLQRVRPYLRR
jgi:hypothetical protein